jgi:hypothetical protein
MIIDTLQSWKGKIRVNQRTRPQRHVKSAVVCVVVRLRVDLGFVGGDYRHIGQLDQHDVPADVC